MIYSVGKFKVTGFHKGSDAPVLIDTAKKRGFTAIPTAGSCAPCSFQLCTCNYEMCVFQESPCQSDYEFMNLPAIEGLIL